MTSIPIWKARNTAASFVQGGIQGARVRGFVEDLTMAATVMQGGLRGMSVRQGFEQRAEIALRDHNEEILEDRAKGFIQVKHAPHRRLI